MENPFRYKTHDEYLEASRTREEILSDIDKRVEEVVRVHQKITRGFRLSDMEMSTVDYVLNNFICDLFHKRAEQVYLLERMGIEDETNGEVGGGDNS